MSRLVNLGYLQSRGSFPAHHQDNSGDLMEQRRLRLGDILDDYCPRERRVTNHAVVAMIDEDVKQTRCTTCDAEHVYKGGKAPRRRKGEAAAPTVSGPTMTAHEEHTHGQPREIIAEPIAPGPIVEQPANAAEPAVETEPVASDEGPVHRPLIRATLPRPEGIKTERPAPDFTIRQNNGRGNGNFRGRGMHAPGGNAGRPGGGGARFGRGPQQGQGRGQGRGANQGFGRAAGGQRHGGPKKRSR
jgi:hypothetical protein